MLAVKALKSEFADATAAALSSFEEVEVIDAEVLSEVEKLLV